MFQQTVRLDGVVGLWLPESASTVTQLQVVQPGPGS
jgi:hypothetical protein